LGISPLVCELFAVWLDDGTIERVVSERRAEAAVRQKLAAEIFESYKIHGHPASYHVWLELPESVAGHQLAIKARRRGVMVAPSEIFAFDGRPSDEAVRISLEVPATDRILRSGLETVVALLRGSDSHQRATV
jgi:DNA-binding transcriptional MocR family regulator